MRCGRTGRRPRAAEARERGGGKSMKKACAAVCMAIGMTMATQGGQVACVGQIVPGERTVRIAAPAGSIVGELLAARGSRVKKGDVVAVLREEPAYRARLERARREVEVARAELALVLAGERPELAEAQEWQVAADEAEAKLLDARLARHEKLEKGRHASEDEFEEAAARAEAMRAKIRRQRSILAGMRTARAEEAARAEAGLRLAEAREEAAEAELELQRIRAPASGEILEVHAWPGEGIWENGAVASLGETDRMMVLAEVYETDLKKVAAGQRATFRGHAFEGERGGEVVEVQRMLEGSRAFPMAPSEYVDRRIAVARIRPDEPAGLAGLSHAHVTVTIQTP